MDLKSKYINHTVQEIDSGKSFLEELKYDTYKRMDEIYEYSKYIGNKFLHTLKTTKAEYLIIIPLGIAIGSFKSCSDETAIGKQKPIAFSETSNIIRRLEHSGVEVPVTTEYLTKTNDINMKINESWNESWVNYLPLIENHDKSFASELELHVDKAFKRFTYELPELTAQVPQLADKLLFELRNLKELSKNIKMSNEYFDKAWNEYHHDETHEECHDECTTVYTTNSDGETESEEVCERVCVDVYDWTDNDYDYFKTYGENASSKLNKIIEWFPGLPMNKDIVPATETGAWNEDAMERSMRLQLDGKKLSNEDFLRLANTWAYGSGINISYDIMFDLYRKINEDAIKWTKAKNTAKNTFIRTYDHSRPEPEEFTIAEHALNHGIDLVAAIDDLIESIEFTKKETPLLYADITKLINIYNGFEEGDMGELADRIVTRSDKIYEKNFPGGFDMTPANYWNVPLWGLVGGLASIPFAFLLDFSIDKLSNRNNKKKKLLA